MREKITADAGQGRLFAGARARAVYLAFATLVVAMMLTGCEEIVGIEITDPSTSELDLVVGETHKFFATVITSQPYGFSFASPTTSVLWTSDSPDIVSVTQDGFARALSAGESFVTAKTASGLHSASVLVTVVSIFGDEVPVISVAIDSGDMHLLVGETHQLSAIILPEDATNLSVSWSSDDGSVATVSDNGVVTAVGAGITDITVTADDGGFTASVKITVSESTIAVTGVTVSDSAITLVVGDTFALSASIEPANATDQNVSWSSSDVAITTVSAQGVVTALGAGSAQVTATTNDGDYTDSTLVTITNPSGGLDGDIELDLDNPPDLDWTAQSDAGPVTVESSYSLAVDVSQYSGASTWNYSWRVNGQLQLQGDGETSFSGLAPQATFTVSVAIFYDGWLQMLERVITVIP